MLKIRHTPLIIILVALFCICIISFLVIRNRITSKSFEDLLGTNDTKISKIFMRNGCNGSSVSTTDKTKIKELVTLVNDRFYSRSNDQIDRNGYDYFYTFYVEDKDILTITGSGEIVYIEGEYYDATKAISNIQLTEWFNSIPSLSSYDN